MGADSHLHSLPRPHSTIFFHIISHITAPNIIFILIKKNSISPQTFKKIPRPFLFFKKYDFPQNFSFPEKNFFFLVFFIFTPPPKIALCTIAIWFFFFLFYCFYRRHGDVGLIRLNIIFTRNREKAWYTCALIKKQIFLFTETSLFR